MGAAGKGVAKSSLPIEWALASGLGIAAQKKLKRSGCDKTQKVNAAESQQLFLDEKLLVDFVSYLRDVDSSPHSYRVLRKDLKIRTDHSHPPKYVLVTFSLLHW